MTLPGVEQLDAGKRLAAERRQRPLVFGIAVVGRIQATSIPAQAVLVLAAADRRLRGREPEPPGGHGVTPSTRDRLLHCSGNTITARAAPAVGRSSSCCARGSSAGQKLISPLA